MESGIPHKTAWDISAKKAGNQPALWQKTRKTICLPHSFNKNHPLKIL
jgi:hypothetical protein